MAAEARRPVYALPDLHGRTRWLLVALVVLAGIGVVGALFQLLEGLAVTHLSDGFIWGLYIAAFMVFMAAAGGTLAIAGAILLFELDRFKSLVRLSLLLSISSVVVAGGLIVIDLGNPLRAAGFYIWAQPYSPLVGDFVVVHLFVIFAVVLLWLLSRRDLAAQGSRLAFGAEDTPDGRERDQTIAKYVGGLALATATLFYPTGWLFAVLPSRVGWFDPVLGVMAVTKGLVAGLALLIVVAVLADRFSEFELDRPLVKPLGTVLGVMLVVHVVYLEFAREFPEAWAESQTFAEAFSTVFVTDSVTFYLWIVFGGLIPLALLALPSMRERLGVLFAASALAFVGTLFESGYILWSGFPGDYWPNLFEVVVTIGFVAIGAIVVTLGLWLLPVQNGLERPTGGDA